jgi:hypothetical protein
MRRYGFFSAVLCGFVLCAAIVVTGVPSASPLFYERERLFSLSWLDGPVFWPNDEIRLQAALAPSAGGIETSGALNKRLREISIRTALEDTARLHYDLG